MPKRKKRKKQTNPFKIPLFGPLVLPPRVRRKSLSPQERLRKGLSVPEQFKTSPGGVPGTKDRMEIRRMDLRKRKERGA